MFGIILIENRFAHVIHDRVNVLLLKQFVNDTLVVLSENYLCVVSQCSVISLTFPYYTMQHITHVLHVNMGGLILANSEISKFKTTWYGPGLSLVT